MRLLFLILLATHLLCSCQSSLQSWPSSPIELDEQPLTDAWQSILERARGQTISLVMPLEEEAISNYMRNYVAKEMQKRYAISLKISGGQPTSLLRLLKSGQDNRGAKGTIDIIGINDIYYDDFSEAGLLTSIDLDILPNSIYLQEEYKKEAGKKGLCPWGLKQPTLYYNADKVLAPPKDIQSLATILRQYPGSMAIQANEGGYALLELFLQQKREERQRTDFEDDSSYLANIGHLIGPYLWKKDKEPLNLEQELVLIEAEELLFWPVDNSNTLEYHIAQKRKLPQLKPISWPQKPLGTLSYFALNRASKNQEAVWVFCNFMLSLTAQYHKANPIIWGDLTPLDPKKIPEKAWITLKNNSPALAALIQEQVLLEIKPLNKNYRQLFKKLLKDSF